MDPITQGVAGIVAAQNVPHKTKKIAALSIIGGLSAMTPDLDILIRSADDPLLFLEYHRQFTHSLIFIPVGGLICASVFWLLLRKWLQLNFKPVLIAATIGYATHGLLDACTSYGTLLFWPFSDTRVAWHVISIIDPLYTLPLIALSISRLVTGKKLLSHIALAWMFAYPTIGLIQRQRAETSAVQLAQQRNHTPAKLEAKPSFANLLVWKVIYQHNDRYYTDAIRLGTQPRWYQGTSIPVLNVKQDYPWLNPQSQQAKDIERFRWFSNNYLSVNPQNKNQIIDMRYSMLPNEITGLWGITLNPATEDNRHIGYYANRGDSQAVLGNLADMIFNVEIATKRTIQKP